MNNTSSNDRRISRRHLGAVVVTLAVLSTQSCGGDSDVAEPDPAAVVDEYRSAYNSGDLERVMALFTDESVVTGHPYSARSEGRVAIRDVQRRDIERAAPSNAYRMFNVEVGVDTVTWDHEWTDADGERWCADGHRAVIADGTIMSWAFPSEFRRC